MSPHLPRCCAANGADTVLPQAVIASCLPRRVCILIRTMVYKKPATAAVLGASGYTGQELLGVLSRHPELRAVFATSESEAGQWADGGGLRYVRAEDVPLGDVDVVFTC